MKFSIVVAAYNVAEYLEECVDSLADQNFPNSEYEVVIVDDGSTDGQTSKLCDELSYKYEVVRTIHQENGGLSSARNTGIKHSKGEYLLFVDGDDFWSNKNFLEKLSFNIEKYCSDVVIFSYEKYYSKAETIEVRFDKAPVYGKIDSNISQIVSTGLFTAPAWNKCVKRILFENGLDFPVGLLSEDCLYCADVLKNIKSYSILNEMCYMYRQNRLGSITNIVKEKNIHDILKSIHLGLIDIEKYNKDIRKGLEVYFSISYISILPYVNQYLSNPEIKRLLFKYRYLLKYSRILTNKEFKLTGLISQMFGLKVSTKLFAYLLKFYKKYRG